MTALVFPGQGSQFPGMGKDLYENSELARSMFDEANDILGYELARVMFEGSEEELRETRITQPAIFLHSIVCLKNADPVPPFKAVAGHSLGEFSALVANGCLDWKAALKLVQIRAFAMQRACEDTEGTMAAVIGLEDELVEKICLGIDEIVVPANYNCPGQIVISGSNLGVELATSALKDAGAKRVIPLSVGGAFHSSLMSSAKPELSEAINECSFNTPFCPVYQNINGKPESDPAIIKTNIISQLDSPVRWTQSMSQMIRDGITNIIEVGGTGKVLSGMFKKLDRNIPTEALVK